MIIDQKQLVIQKTNVNLINELKNENFLVQNSSKTFFKNKKLDNIQPYNLLKDQLPDVRSN